MNYKTNIIIFSIVIIVTTFVARGSNNMISTTIPLLAKYDLNLTQGEIGILAALSSFTSFLTTIVLNARMNSGQRRKAFIVSSLFYALTLPLYAFSNFILLWVLTSLTGATLGLIMPNIITSASLLEDRKLRERIIALYTLTLSLSLIAGPAIESYILRYVSLRDVFIYFTPFGIVLFILSFFLQFPEEKKSNLKVRVWSNEGFRVAIYNILIYNIPFAIITTFLGIYERDTYGISLSEVSLVYSIFFASSFSARLYLFFRPPERLVLEMMLSASLTGIGIFMIFISNNFLIFLVAMILLGIPHGSTYPLSVMTLGRFFKVEERSVANSHYFSVMMIIGILIPIISGYLISALGFRYIFLILLLVVMFFFILLRLSTRSKNFQDILSKSIS